MKLLKLTVPSRALLFTNVGDIADVTNDNLETATQRCPDTLESLLKLPVSNTQGASCNRE